MTYLNKKINQNIINVWKMTAQGKGRTRILSCSGIYSSSSQKNTRLKCKRKYRKYLDSLEHPKSCQIVRNWDNATICSIIEIKMEGNNVFFFYLLKKDLQWNLSLTIRKRSDWENIVIERVKTDSLIYNVK